MSGVICCVSRGVLGGNNTLGSVMRCVFLRFKLVRRKGHEWNGNGWNPWGQKQRLLDVNNYRENVQLEKMDPNSPPIGSQAYVG